MDNKTNKQCEQEKQVKKELQLTINEKGKKIYIFPNFQDYPFIIEPDYQLFIIKGWGTYGLVASGLNKITNQLVAVKRVHKVFDNLGDTKRILRQIKILKFLKHKGIVGLKDMMKIEEQDRQTFNQIYFCMEYMDYTLQKFIYSKEVISDQMIQFVLYQLLSAINYMHSAGIIHRDLKPENILINKKLELKIADMNLARKESTEQITYYVTSRPYRAPEIIINSNNAYNNAIDIWAIGCILAEMLGKTILFQGRDHIDQLKRFVAILGKPPIKLFENEDPISAQGLLRIFNKIPDRQKIDWKFLFPKASEKALDLLDHMLVYDPTVRYTANQCLNHPFLQDYKERPRLKSKEFDFSFDKIQMTTEKLRNAIYQEVESYQERSKARKSTTEVDILQKKVKQQ